MKVVIAGSRSFTDFEYAEKYIDLCLCQTKQLHEIIILSGACRGADKIGEMYAEKNNFKLEYFPADWSRFGKAAGPIRNKLMIENADVVICFWDGKSRGTKSLIQQAKTSCKTLYINMLQ